MTLDPESAPLDETLAALGVHRIPLPIPFAHAGGPINAYLIDDADGRVAMIDTGLSTETCIAALHDGFAAAGKRVQDVSRVVITHGHVDHFGLARYVQDRSGAPVLVPRRDWNKVLVGETMPPLDEHLERFGVPAGFSPKIAAADAMSAAIAPRLDRVEPLEPGARLSFARFEASVIPFPGHTPGLVCLHAEGHGVLFSNDHLLQRVSPNPLFEPVEDESGTRHRALVAYLESVGRLYDMDIGWLLPGHGEPFRDHRATIDGLRRFHERRKARIESLLEAQPRTVMGLVRELFGEAEGIQLFLMISEVVGNLEVLEDEGRVTHDPEEVPFVCQLR